jgi:hypothetical protein
VAAAWQIVSGTALPQTNLSNGRINALLCVFNSFALIL